MKTTARRKARRAQRGMTLIEIMVVLVILGMMATLIGINVVGNLKDAKIKSATLDCRNIANAVDMYNIKHGNLPDSLDQLVPAEIRDIHKDPWKHPYVYVKNGDNAYQVISYGPDGAQGGGDDIVVDSSDKSANGNGNQGN